jgi:peptidoglycan/xylan/chitin deacetylase (PgdA/CDA1 family)
MLGLDCDRPRGAYIKTPEGMQLAQTKIRSLERINAKLDYLTLPRTYFVCGQFLESMVSEFGHRRLQSVFPIENPLAEIADHTHSHNIWKAIPSRPDKTQILTADQIVQEYRQNSLLFYDFFERDLSVRGVRAPLGYYQGVDDQPYLIDLLAREGILYLSSDLRDETYAPFGPLLNRMGGLRQPRRYTNGLVEIPSHGWHDTVFGGHSRTAIDRPFPYTYTEALRFFRQFFSEAMELAGVHQRNLYLGLVLHPSNIALYDSRNTFFDDLKAIVEDLKLNFCQYRDAWVEFANSLVPN